jgi:hypothetical protein
VEFVIEEFDNEEFDNEEKYMFSHPNSKASWFDLLVYGNNCLDVLQSA